MSSRMLAAMVGMVVMSGVPAQAATRCSLSFHLEGWSAFYKTAHGGGQVSCDNGQVTHVVIHSTGGGLTFGSHTVHGRGDFSPIADIDEVFGTYANAEAHAGMGPSSDAQVVTKGSVSLAFSGTGNGVDVGFAFGKLTIARVHHAPRREATREEPLEPAAPAPPPPDGY